MGSCQGVVSTDAHRPIVPPEGARVSQPGLTVERRLCSEGAPRDQFEWVARDARIIGASGQEVFTQADIQVPSSWSATALNVVASKYFAVRASPDGSAPTRERSVADMVGRVVRTISGWARGSGVFASAADEAAFADELECLLLGQRYAFNSPVFFNVGVDPQPQCSACFINGVEDTMESILDLARIEGRLFKGGSGTGTNLSVIRGSMEPLSGGGTASGPVSFMRGFDAFAGVIKSGGKTRRAAKMVMLDCDHPDIEDFVHAKANEERKAWALIDQGYDGSFDGEAYASVAFQNANHSVRVSDAFMEAALADRPWPLRARVGGETVREISARGLLKSIAEATHVCGDPGLQFDDTINGWHPCPNSGRINGSNPCSEYMFLDDSACNLGSLNLMSFVDADGAFDVDGFAHATRLATIAQELLVDSSSYPTDRIAANSQRFRPLGLGYANLGALLMTMGLPYDSDAGRAFAAAVTALMGGIAVRTSAELAGALGPFAGFEENREPTLRVMERHASAAEALPDTPVTGAAQRAWREALAAARTQGLRNAQSTVLAPTGTIAFMMDCDSTGIEPDLALVKLKRLSGGGLIEVVNRSVAPALRRLGYTPSDVDAIVQYVQAQGTAEGAPALDPVHLPVFDCALPAPGGTRSISPRGHIAMMAAVQPFLSGAISKTVNVPSDATQDDIFALYVDAWRSGLKAVAIYRDGSKRIQPIAPKGAVSAGKPAAVRRRLEPERASITHKFAVGGHSGYITVGLYPEGAPGEIFITMSKEGSTISGLMDTIATSISFALQYGVPLRVLVDRFSHVRFEPAGFTGNPDIPMAKSVVDYVFRWLGNKFLGDAPQPARPTDIDARLNPGQMRLPIQEPADGLSDAPPCRECGSLTVRAGACYSCPVCGATSGCG